MTILSPHDFPLIKSKSWLWNSLGSRECVGDIGPKRLFQGCWRAIDSHLLRWPPHYLSLNSEKIALKSKLRTLSFRYFFHQYLFCYEIRYFRSGSMKSKSLIFFSKPWHLLPQSALVRLYHEGNFTVTKIQEWLGNFDLGLSNITSTIV